MSKRCAWLFVLVAILVVPSAWPQASTGAVNGTVRDQAGAVIPGVTVKLTGSNTNATSQTTTNDAGFYMFAGLVPGPYVLTVEAPGMAKFEGSLVVETAFAAVVDVTMK